MIDIGKDEIIANFDFDADVSVVRDSYISSSKRAVTLPLVGHMKFPQSNGDCHIKAGHVHGKS